MRRGNLWQYTGPGGSDYGVWSPVLPRRGFTSRTRGPQLIVYSATPATVTGSSLHGEKLTVMAERSQIHDASSQYELLHLVLESARFEAMFCVARRSRVE